MIYDLKKLIIKESEVSSKLSDDFRSKGKLDLNKFKMEKMTKEFINNHKSDTKMMRHASHEWNGVAWVDKDNNVVAYVMSGEAKGYENSIWIKALEVSNKYKGYGLSSQLLKYAENNMRCNALSVEPSNEVAVNLYLKNGWKITQESKNLIKQGKLKIYHLYKNKRIKY